MGEGVGGGGSWIHSAQPASAQTVSTRHAAAAHLSRVRARVSHSYSVYCTWARAAAEVFEHTSSSGGSPDLALPSTGPAPFSQGHR